MVVDEEEAGGEGRWRLGGGACDYEEEEGDIEIDLRAEKFISMFYEEMKMQNQISYLPYHEFSDSDEWEVATRLNIDELGSVFDLTENRY